MGKNADNTGNEISGEFGFPDINISNPFSGGFDWKFIAIPLVIAVAYYFYKKNKDDKGSGGGSSGGGSSGGGGSGSSKNVYAYVDDVGQLPSDPNGYIDLWAVMCLYRSGGKTPELVGVTGYGGEKPDLGTVQKAISQAGFSAAVAAYDDLSVRIVALAKKARDKGGKLYLDVGGEYVEVANAIKKDRSIAPYISMNGMGSSNIVGDKKAHYDYIVRSGVTTHMIDGDGGARTVFTMIKQNTYGNAWLKEQMYKSAAGKTLWAAFNAGEAQRLNAGQTGYNHAVRLADCMTVARSVHGLEHGSHYAEYFKRIEKGADKL